jgi:hypothetical protein
MMAYLVRGDVDIFHMGLVHVVPSLLTEHVLIDADGGVPYIFVSGLIECRRSDAAMATPDVTVCRDDIFTEEAVIVLHKDQLTETYGIHLLKVAFRGYGFSEWRSRREDLFESRKRAGVDEWLPHQERVHDKNLVRFVLVHCEVVEWSVRLILNQPRVCWGIVRVISVGSFSVPQFHPTDGSSRSKSGAT